MTNIPINVQKDTIFAQASAYGKAGVTVFRISGPRSLYALQQLLDGGSGLQLKPEQLKPRYMYLRKIYVPETRQQIDEAMIVYFPAGASFTGEEVVEIYTHGSLAVIKMLNIALLAIEGLRVAKAGEFTKRAFLNNRFDLTSAEGLADLIDAETELQHKQAIRQLGGGLAKIYDKWRGELLYLMGLIEAYIDFPDEDIPDNVITNINNMVTTLIAEIRKHLEDNNRGERLRAGLKLVIAGRPNVGKSSLLNFLLKRNAAIVSDIAGTTRDVIEGHLDIGGYPINLYDTAGIRTGSLDPVEKIGINKAKEILQDADIKLLIIDNTIIDKIIDKTDLKQTLEQNIIEQNIIEDFYLPHHMQQTDAQAPQTLIILNKVDLLPDKALIKTLIPDNINNLKVVPISVTENYNLDALLNAIKEIAEKIAKPTEHPQITRARHRTQLKQAMEYLSNFSLKNDKLNNDIVLGAEDLRMTIRALSNITGRITVDEILGEIFSNFCIGK